MVPVGDIERNLVEHAAKLVCRSHARCVWSAAFIGSRLRRCACYRYPVSSVVHLPNKDFLPSILRDTDLSASPPDAHPVPDVIFAAVVPEVVPFVKRFGFLPNKELGSDIVAFQDPSNRWHGTIVVTGMGSNRARDVGSRVVERLKPDRVMLTGLAGALSDSLRTGDVFRPRWVIAEGSGDAYEAAAHDTDRTLVTTANLVSSPDDKSALKEQTNAEAVDMETVEWCRICERAGIEWTCIRVIMDEANHIVPKGMSDLVDDAGRPRLIASAFYALTHPWHIPILMKTGRASGIGARVIAECIAERIGLSNL